MARLSSIAGDYSNSAGITDRQQYTAVGGELTYDLSFIDGAEEVYVDGARLSKGATSDYTTDEAAGSVSLNTALTAGQEIILIGRSATSEIPYTKAVSESVVLTDGQVDVIFSSIETTNFQVYVSGVLVDKGRLVTPTDYSVTDSTTITLTHSYPEGTVIEGVQSARLSITDPDGMIVYDGETSKSLSTRFAATKESDVYFVETNGMQLQDLATNLLLKKWTVDSTTGIPGEDTAGQYPVLKIDKSYWNPMIQGTTLEYYVVSWTVTGDSLSILVSESISGDLSYLEYGRRVVYSTSTDGQAIDYGLITEGVYNAFDDGGL